MNNRIFFDFTLYSAGGRTFFQMGSHQAHNRGAQSSSSARPNLLGSRRAGALRSATSAAPDLRAVLIWCQQLLELAGIGEFDFVEPPAGVRLAVDQGRIVHDRLVDRNNLPAHR